MSEYLPWYEEYFLDENRIRTIQFYVSDQLRSRFPGQEIDVQYQYFYSNVTPEGKKPRITVCYAKIAGVGTGVGIAMCSLKDEPDKLIGRTIAYSRAARALRTGRASYPISFQSWVIHNIMRVSDLCLHHDSCVYEGQNMETCPNHKSFFLKSDEDFRFERIPRRAIVSIPV